MADGTSTAVTEAARLDEIGFPEFTCKLITDVFDALVSANIRQTEAYVELLRAVSASLKDYINNTKDDIGGDQILQFLAQVLPPETANADKDGTKVKPGSSLTDDEAEALNKALTVPEEAGVSNNNQVAAAGALDQDKVNAIIEAVAVRLAANKYDILKEMVKQGILRIVVESGTIETRLTFTTYGSTFYQKQSGTYHRDSFRFRAKARTGSLLSSWVKASASTSYTNINIRTTKETQRDISGSRVQIFGGVKLNIKTDYLPLNQ
ncbi:hypothetical protein GF1_12590 [Desulfolithobacter dissulfuricans]|uniref:Uncharacterized protein n=1 Tax=Desulfolithobacter dissulfuricans TaxID=2795293 RepID=A0A915TZZ7_9BACT|nr:hypothetical protein [Desulfolithobacter dissulfuricans]BCO08883.1 hypothetical protein GF1_12590 [Desulfolithobacter dissulfuricans]